MENKFSFQNQKGLTMIEAIIATFILVVAIIGSYLIFVEISSTTKVISSRLTAAYLAQEGMEIIRNIRDTNWLKEVSWSDLIDGVPCSSGCEVDYRTEQGDTSTLFSWGTSGNYLKLDENNYYSYSIHPLAIATKFKRKIITTHLNDNTLGVSVLVQWEDRGKPYEFLVEGYLYNWK
ncbi:hypothetical protein KJ786_01390 [Patescibacteria group bacterium]|nr:hypothetical protein [Patescibacteria group bacterium]